MNNPNWVTPKAKVIASGEVGTVVRVCEARIDVEIGGVISSFYVEELLPYIEKKGETNGTYRS